MSDEGEKNPIIKAATNEWGLLGWRSFIALVCTAATTIGGISLTYLADIKSSQASLKKDFTDYQLVQEGRLGRLEGDVSGIKGSVLVHRDRLIGLEGEVRTLWSRLYDARTTPNRSTP